MAQFQAEVPDPLRNHLPALLTPGGVRAPAVGVLFLVFIGEGRLKGPAMEIQLDHVAGSERLLGQVGEEQFVDRAVPFDAHLALCCPGWVGGDDDPTVLGPRSYRNIRTVEQLAHDLTFGTLLALVGLQMQARLDRGLSSVA